MFMPSLQCIYVHAFVANERLKCEMTCGNW